MNHDSRFNFEINLLPVISLLAVLISFLLLTAAWIQIGSLEVKQALGGETSSEGESLSLWIEMKPSRQLELKVKKGNSEQVDRTVLLNAERSSIDLESFSEALLAIKKEFPDLKTALVMPSHQTAYHEMIGVMDLLKQSAIGDIGVAPL